MTFRIEEHLQEIRRPGVFPEPGPVEVIQTHISVVCLAGSRAYKLKKAVRLPFLDFSSVDRRERACRDELRLNRRLCPDAYLDVVPVRRAPQGLRVAEAEPKGGEVVDHAVRMVRMPQERMLDALLAEGGVSSEDIARLAELVAVFHTRMAAEADDTVREAGSPHSLVVQLRANFTDTETIAGRCFDAALHAALHARVEAAVPWLEQRLEERERAGRIVEGHGDLHARNVCMIEPPAIYDCIEFRKDFRCEDVATEVAFMAMDLRHRGHRELAEAFVDAYVDASGDEDLRAVLPELLRYRAMVRAKVDAIASEEESIPEEAKARARAAARRHLRLCAWTRVEDDGPVVLIASGLPASGKSHVLDAVGREAGWPVIATDRVRKELAGVAPAERLPGRFYRSKWSDRTYAEVVARGAAARGSAILDGNFPTSEHRRAAGDAARAAGKRCVVVHVTIDEATARRRLRARSADASAVSDADESVFEKLRDRYAAPEPQEGLPIVTIDGAAADDAALDALACALLTLSG